MKTDLLKFTESGGCSAKISPAMLEEVLRQFPLPYDPDVLVDINTHDDAGVYRLSDDLALVITTDFFPPVCSDPYEFGQIAAANSISDVYAMGGEPALALNLMMFPASSLPVEAYTDILRGGYDKAAEAGVRILGGHTIDDPIPKYGLAVIGFVNPANLITNAGIRPGDKLILTKPLGTGVILAGDRLGLIEGKELEEAMAFMKMLNNTAARVVKGFGIRGGTDITGFGLAGHTLKMARASNVHITVNLQDVPLITGTERLLSEGCIPGAAFRNQEFAGKDLNTAPDADYDLMMAAYDAQTSGGLLVGVPASLAAEVLDELKAAGLIHSAIIGEADLKKDHYLSLKK